MNIIINNNTIIINNNNKEEEERMNRSPTIKSSSKRSIGNSVAMLLHTHRDAE